jgi:hypothetical protein
LCLSVFPWAPFRSTKAAIKLHTLLDLARQYSIVYSDQRWQMAGDHRARRTDHRTGRFLHHGLWLHYGYIDFERLGRLSEAGSFFVTRAKSNLKVQRRYSHKVDKTTGLICDQTVVLTVFIFLSPETLWSF